MPTTRKVLLAILVVLLLILCARIFLYFNTTRKVVFQDWPSIPEFTDLRVGSWLNSKPISIEELRGKVTLLFIWTFD